jgi:predicted dehydrogenase
MAVESIDAVTNSPDAIALIATPPRFHLSQVNAALKRGWHVLCSTPLTPNAVEAATMIASAQRHERLLAVDLRTRLFPAALYLREVCRDHLLGPPLSFRMDVGQTHRATDDVSKTEKLEHAHGVLADLGAPILDLLTWCFGSAGVVSYADDAMGGAEATAVIELEFRDGVRGTVHLSRDWPTEDAGTFVFERGIVRWTAHRPAAVTLQIASAPFAIAGELTAPLSAVRATPTAAPLATDASACASQLENLIAAIAGRSALRMPATEAMHSLPLIDDCYARRSPLPQPWLSPNDAVHARALSPPPMVRRA